LQKKNENSIFTKFTTSDIVWTRYWPKTEVNQRFDFLAIFQLFFHFFVNFLTFCYKNFSKLKKYFVKNSGTRSAQGRENKKETGDIREKAGRVAPKETSGKGKEKGRGKDAVFYRRDQTSVQNLTPK